MSGNPSKKIRLDLQTRNDGSAGNEDLWGQDDLTAEEFDILEIQATQSCSKTISNDHPHTNNKLNNFADVSMYSLLLKDSSLGIVSLFKNSFNNLCLFF